jgi:protein tyrosine phosphatase (PTP) superfamily phosphohydrolase (DUF442 family)
MEKNCQQELLCRTTKYWAKVLKASIRSGYCAHSSYTLSGFNSSNILRVRPGVPNLRAVAIAVVLFAAPASPRLGPETPGAASSSDPGSRSIARKIPVPGVPNFAEVTPTLFRGAQPTELGFKTLAQMGVQVIVDLRSGDEAKREQKEVTALGMKFVGLPWRCTDPKDDDFANFLALLRDNTDKKIFVHCRAGIDRTGMMIASYRMAEQGWTAAEALREMKAFGFSSFHGMVCYGLGSYEQRFPRVESSSPAFSTQRLGEQKPAPPPLPQP